MKSPTEQLIDLVERLRPTGEIGDGMVAELHDLAARARAELGLSRPFLDLGSVCVPMIVAPDGSIRFG